MSDCPVCRSHLHTENAGIPFINFRRRFVCPVCKWKMDLKEVHRRGNLDRIFADNFQEGERHKPSKKAPDTSKKEEKPKVEKKISKEWEKIDKLPNWAFKKMKSKRTNRVNGDHYTYKRERNNFYKKLRKK